jgi:hypothetical protein
MEKRRMSRELRKYWPSEGHFETELRKILSLKVCFLTTSRIPEPIKP